MPAVPLYQVDAFTRAPFAGNPAAVVVLARWPDDALLQAVAAENNLSETAFLVRRADAWELRWLTPAVEVALCGHATLAAAHVLLAVRAEAGDAARFDTRSGRLTVVREGAGYAMDFPAAPPARVPAPAGLAEALGATPREVWAGRGDLVAVLDGPAAVRDLAPDLAALARLAARGVAVTASGDEGARDRPADFVSRFFAPQQGIPEDPVTGSLHCTLAPLWAARLGRSTLLGRQLSRRGGEVGCELRGDRVVLRGDAVLVVRGELLLP